MVVADALSKRSDHSIGVKEDNEQVTALPEDLWIRLLDKELQDAVAQNLLQDDYALDVLSKLNDPSQSPVKWSSETDPNGPKLLFYNQMILTFVDISYRTIMTCR